MSQLGFEPIFDSFLLAACLALALLLLLGIKPQFGSLTPRRQRTLIGLRLVIVLLAAFALLRPTWITTVRTPRRKVLVVLLDASRSMLLKSGRADETRWQAQKNTMTSSADELARLSRSVEIRAYAYDLSLKPLTVEGGQIAIPAAPEGQQTDIGLALDSALKAEQGKPVAGVFLLGDGTQTAFEPLVETQQAARKLRDDFSAPLYTVTFGLSGDAEQTRDVAIDRLDEQFTVFVKNEFLVRGQVRVRGFVNKEVPVELTLTDDQKQVTVLSTQKIMATADNQQLEVEFPVTMQTPGRFRLTLHAQEQDGEQVTKNNKLDAYLTVLEGGLRVLYLDGENLGEQKFLRRAIDASPDIELDYKPIDRRTRQNWPVDLGIDLASAKYDAFILGDLDAAALGKANLEALAAAIGKGKGLLMIGGLSSFGRGHYRGSPLAAALPIEIDSLEEADFGAEELDRFFLPGPVPMIPTATHSITRLATGAENFDLWRRLPPLAWAHKFGGIKQSPGVRVLLESPRQEPLLVSGEFGAGRTLAFAGQSTYLWPLHGFAKEHNRFWRQVILWLVKKDDLNRDDVWIKLDQRRFNPGSRVSFETGARSGTGDAIADARLETNIVGPDGRKQAIALAKDGSQFRASWQALSPGDYTIETVASQGEKQLGTAKAEFVVFDRDVELSTPAADPDLMASLSAWTKKEGGRAVAAEELPGLLEELAARPPEYEVRQTRWKLGATSGDAWGLLLAMTVALSIEWFLRKRWGLV